MSFENCIKLLYYTTRLLTPIVSEILNKSHCI